MSVDYYKILGVNRDASDQDIKRAYRKLSMKWHPDKNTGDAAPDRFAEIAEAYEVLNDKKTRAVFDQFGEAGLKSGVPDGSGGFSGGGYRFTTNPNTIFEQFFGTANPFVDMSFSSGVFDNGFGAANATPGNMFGGVKSRKAGDVNRELALSLEDLYSGCTRRIKVSRKRLVEGQSRYVDSETTLAITVQPGLKRGTKITFPREGDQGENVIPADVVFYVEEEQHDRFDRDQDNLYYMAHISLTEALTSCTVKVKTLDGRTLSIPCNEVISPASVKRVPGEGMPIVNRPGEFGDLFIRFHIRFPEYLSLKQQKGLQDLLSQDPHKPPLKRASQAAAASKVEE